MKELLVASDWASKLQAKLACFRLVERRVLTFVWPQLLFLSKARFHGGSRGWNSVLLLKCAASSQRNHGKIVFTKPLQKSRQCIFYFGGKDSLTREIKELPLSQLWQRSRELALLPKTKTNHVQKNILATCLRLSRSPPPEALQRRREPWLPVTTAPSLSSLLMVTFFR